ncbi:MAG: hypothetical protein KBF16_06430, partial [Parabacteroides sp.]|nr:hypothetical protein [Parabacteroides sp.]
AILPPVSFLQEKACLSNILLKVYNQNPFLFPITYTKRTTSEKYGAKKHFFHTINGQSFIRQIRH